MKILLVSFYYQPDLSAGSFRTTALVDALLSELPEHASVEVVTTLPNRYSSFALDAPLLEVHPRLTVHRVPLAHHNSGMFDQSRAFFGFAKQVLGFTRNKRYDLVYATSSRLMTASLGALVARRLGAPLYLDIRDIFVDTIKDVLSPRITWLLKPVFSMIENLTIKQAERVNLVSAGFLPYFTARYPEAQFVVFTNGIDEEFLNALSSFNHEPSKQPLTVLYAGNMGEGQGLHTIIPQLASRFAGRLHFVCLGDGGRKKQLQEAIATSGVSNVEVLPPVRRSELISAYQAADVLFLHLNDYDAFRKVLPSKIFEYAALGKPIWAGVAGYAREFIADHVSNAAVFSPCDDQDAENAFARLEMVSQPRHEFVEQFARVTIMRSMAADILSLASNRVK